MALTVEKGAEDLVIRARNGDQLAMATLNEIRKAAQRGNQKAQMGFEAVKAYIQKNPTEANRKAMEKDVRISGEARQVLKDLRKVTKKSSMMGAENASVPDPATARDTCIIVLALPTVGGERALNAGCVLLANGPKLTDARIRQIGEAIKDESMRAYFYRYIVNYCPTGREPELPSQLDAIAKAGRVIGQARALQIARLPNSPVGLVSPNVGWELGE